MKKLVVTLCLVVFALCTATSPAMAILPFSKEWKAKYSDSNTNETFVKAVKEANCNVCHDASSKSKKDRNPYGMAVSKYLKKGDYEKMKGDAEAAKKYILEGLDKAEADKAADGKSFGDKIKAGSLPAAA
jgi:cytochrome c553